MKIQRIHRKVLATVAVLGAVLCPGLAPAFAQCDEVSHQWRRVEINLGGLTAPIVENAGHLADDVAFAAVGATGTGARFGDNGRVDIVISLLDDLVRVGFEPVDADGPISLAPTEPVYGTVYYAVEGGPGALPAWGAVEARGLWGGATLEHRFTGRAWRMRLTGDAADLSRFAWRPTGIAEISSEERSGNLLLGLEADVERRLTLHPAVATAGEESHYLPFVADAEGTLRLGGEVPEGAGLEIVLVMAPYYHEADAVADGRGGYLAAGAAVDALETGGGSGRDVAVVRTFEDGRTFRGMTILASSGDDRHAGIASRAGDAYLAGTAGAADFPLAARHRGETWPAPFAARIDALGELRAGGYLRPHGLDSARDVAVDAEGRVLISGAATAGAKDAGGLELTAVLPADEGAPRTRYAVASFDGTLKAAGGLQTFEGAVTELPLELRPDCEGGLFVGLGTLAAGTLSCPALFPDWIPRSYPDPAVVPSGTSWLDYHAQVRQPSFPHASWGFHALKWKQASQNYPPYDPVAAAQATSPAVPVGHVGWLDALRLNALEANSSIFPNGDPGGDWEYNFATATIARRGLEAAIGAAAYAAFWSSPTYMNLSLDYPRTDGVGVMELTFCSFKDPFGAAGLGPIEICQNHLPGGLPIDVFDATCVDQVPLLSDVNQIFLDEVRLHQWYFPAPNILVDEDLMPGHEFMTRFEQASPGSVYIGDPPAEARFAAGHVSEAVDRQLAFMVEDVPVEVTTYAGGRPVSSKPGSGLVRSVDRGAAE